MSEKEILRIADAAKMIVNGYAFFERKDGLVSILNLYHSDCAMIIDKSGRLIETSMDQIEQKIVLDLCKRNLHFMEE